MRFFRFIIFVYLFSFSFRATSCSSIVDAIEQGIHSAVGALKNIPKLILTPDEALEIAKNLLIGFPLALGFNAFHEICKFSTMRSRSILCRFNMVVFNLLMRFKALWLCNQTQFPYEISIRRRLRTYHLFYINGKEISPYQLQIRQNYGNIVNIIRVCRWWFLLPDGKQTY